MVQYVPLQAKRSETMPAVMEAIDRMSSDERVKTMEYLWAAMTATAEPEPPAWHGDILAERRRRVAAGEEHFIPLEEAMRQLREEVACR
jgi:hypothetical protein